MKKNLFKILFTGLILFSLVSCDQEDGSFDNKVFINSRDMVTTILLKGNDTGSGKFQIKMPQTVGQNVICNIKGDPSKVETYNQAYYDNAVLLEEQYYTISTPEVIIPVGAVLSPEVTISFSNLETLDKDIVYVLPVTIDTRQAGVLGSANTMYYVLKGAALINVVANIDKNNVFVDWKNPKDFEEMYTFTAEALVYPYAFDHMISTLMGIEGKFLLRFGDAGIPGNQLQIATSAGNYTSADLQIPTNTWTHIAMTYDATARTVEVYFDGKKVFTTVTEDIGPVNWGVPHSDESDGKPRCFWIGYSYNGDRYLNADISEVRIWNRVLSQEDINSKNHFYYVEPTSSGLVAYWKFDEGGGTAIKDYSSNENNATASANLTWNKVELPKK